MNVELEPADLPIGYVTRLLINEVAFPGEPLYKSEEDSKQAMFEILWVLDNRAHHPPPGYTEWLIARTSYKNIIDVITAPNQVEDFYRGPKGQLLTAWRVIARVDYLTRLANEGPMGTFGRLLNYAQDLSQSYFENRQKGTDLFASLSHVYSIPVTGRGYAWMTENSPFQPDGNFLAIPRNIKGAAGGNQFYTLRKVIP